MNYKKVILNIVIDYKKVIQNIVIDYKKVIQNIVIDYKKVVALWQYKLEKWNPYLKSATAY